MLKITLNLTREEAKTIIIAIATINADLDLREKVVDAINKTLDNQ